MGAIKWMFCTQCKQTVWLNDVGICLMCQKKYNKFNQPDSWDNAPKCSNCGDPYAGETCLRCLLADDN